MRTKNDFVRKNPLRRKFKEHWHLVNDITKGKPKLSLTLDEIQYVRSLSWINHDLKIDQMS